MSTTIPLTYRVDYEIGLDAKDLTPIQVQEISAQQSIFYCRCLFYLLRQAAISEPHDPLFDYSMFLHMLDQITMHADGVDVIWTLDQRVPLKIPKPIILSLDQFSYRDEMESFWSFSWDVLVVSSAYLYDIAQALIGPEFWEGSPPPIFSMPYALDLSRFKPVDPTPLRRRLGLPVDAAYLLFPHRPDPNKGFKLALQALQRIVKSDRSYKLLIPINPTYAADNRYYNLLRSQAEAMGIGSAVVFHPWIHLPDLPAYFSLGSYTLTLGTVPEGFGLTPVHSVACGTPVVSTRAGALGGLFPPNHGVEYVDFADVDGITSQILAGNSQTQVARGRRYIARHYSIERLIHTYLECFQSARKNSARFNPLRRKNELRLSPWCRFYDDATLWHDYRMQKYKLTSKEVALLKEIRMATPASSLTHFQTQIDSLLRRGIII